MPGREDGRTWSEALANPLLLDGSKRERVCDGPRHQHVAAKSAETPHSGAITERRAAAPPRRWRPRHDAAGSWNPLSVLPAVVYSSQLGAMADQELQQLLANVLQGEEVTNASAAAFLPQLAAGGPPVAALVEAGTLRFLGFLGEQDSTQVRLERQ